MGAKQSANPSLLSKLWRGRHHQSTDLVASIQTFAAAKRPESQMDQCTSFAGSREALKALKQVLNVHALLARCRHDT